MVDDRIKIFQSCGIGGLEIRINEWFEEHPNCYIRSINFRKETDGLWYAYVWYHQMYLEEEQEL